MSRKRLLSASLLMLLCISTRLESAVVGIDFVATPYYNPLAGLLPIDNLLPFQFTDPTTSFSANGALDGVTEERLQLEIVDAIQRTFRRAEIGQPGRMLNVDIRHGLIDGSIGTAHSIGASPYDLSLFGTSYPTGATFRPDLRPDGTYSNQLSITYADTVERIPEFDPSIRFETLEEVVYAVAGTASHEIAHTLDVWNHVPGTAVHGVFPVMASGATNLPLSERLRERRFLDLPNTQYSIPGPPPGGPLIYSVTDTLVNAAGTTFVSDFNFDEVVDLADFDVWFAHRFQAGTGVKTGDANDDGVTDVLDFNLWNSQRSSPLATDDAVNLTIDFEMSSGNFSLRPANTEALGKIMSLMVTGAEPHHIAWHDDMETAYMNGSQQWWFQEGLDSAKLASLASFDTRSGQLPFRRVRIGFANGSTQTIQVPEAIGLPCLIGFLWVLSRSRGWRILVSTEEFPENLSPWLHET